jgi:hypothetical protein
MLGSICCCALHAQAVVARSDSSGRPCASTIFRSGGGALHGLRVQTVAIVPEGPFPKSGWRGQLGRLRATTLSGVVQRYLLFAPGDQLDSMKVGESLRQLRRAMLFNDVWMESTICDGQVDLAVHTRDTWSLRPNARVAPPDYSVSLEDRNLFGSGRRVSIAESRTQFGNGASLALTDPWVAGRNVQGALRLSNIGDRDLATFSLRSNPRSVFDPWQFELLGFLSRRPDPALPTLSVVPSPTSSAPANRVRATHGAVAQFLIARRMDHSTTDALLLQGGVEFDSLAVSTREASGELLYRGRRLELVDIGLVRRAAKFDTVSWFAPGRGFIDVPAVTEFNWVLGVGRDVQSRAAAARYDGWLGRVWRPSRGSLLTTDLWASGLVGGVTTGINRVERLGLSYYREAWHGFWGVRALDEFIEFAEADLRARVIVSPTIDPTFPAVPNFARQAAHTAAISGERSFHLRPLSANALLDGALFASASMRAGIADRGNEQVRVAVLGARLRILSANGTPSSTRIDVGCPVMRSASVSGRCFFGISVGPLFDANRRRDGFRQEQ